MPRIELNDLNEDITITEEEVKHVKGGLISPYQLTSYKLTSPTYSKLSINSEVIEGVYKF